MGARKQNARRPQKSKPRTQDVSREKNIFALRRGVDSSSYPVFEDVSERLGDAIGLCGRLFVPNAVTVTVVGYSRFTREHKQRGPSTFNVLPNIDSRNDTLPASLGRLGIFGARPSFKLAFELISPALEAEVAASEEAFQAAGVRLRQDPNAGGEGHVLHASIALMYQDTIGHYQAPTTLSRLDGLAAAEGHEINLTPIKLPNISQR